MQKKMLLVHFGNLAVNNDENRVAIAEAGAIPPLVKLLTSRFATAKENAAGEKAAGALRALAVNDENKVTIAEARAISPLINLLTSGTAWRNTTTRQCAYFWYC
uniref:Armadillo repeat-containing domain-containing protein n=1 Tax=Aureoumbra lagunensis TaxID=44058 RepID=A0A7S3K3I7_9STRA